MDAALPPVGPATPRPAPAERDPLMLKAKELETIFLTEMLSYAGLAAESGAFGGGMGEAQFSSFLRTEQAKLMVDRGGIGLAEVLFRALSGKQDA